MQPRRSLLFPLLFAFSAPFLAYACTLPEYVYDDDAFTRAQGLAGSGNAGGQAGENQGGAGSAGGAAGASSGGSGKGGNPAGQGGIAGSSSEGGAGGSTSEGGAAGDSGLAGEGGSGGDSAGHVNGGESGSSGQGGTTAGAGQGGTGQAGSGTSGQGGTTAGAGQGGAGQGGAGQGGSGTSGAGQGGSGPSECVVRAFDFTGCSADFTSTGNQNPWECGKPSTGPKADHSGGGSLWATRLTSKPAECEDTFLVSPVVDLSGHSGKPVKIRVWHWGEFRVCDPTKGPLGVCQLACSPPFGLPVDSYSGGVLEVFSGGTWKIVTPSEGYGSSEQLVYTNGGSGDPKDGGTPPCQDSSLDGKKGFAAKGVNKQWVLSTFDVSSYTTADFQFRFHFASAPNEECFPNTAGWYIDDVAVFYAGSCKLTRAPRSWLDSPQQARLRRCSSAVYRAGMDAANTDDAQVKTPDSSGVRWSGRLAAVWGLLGVTALLGQALWRLTPIALDAIRSMTEPLPWAVLISWTLMNAYAEGYRGFHRRFSPRVIARAAHLARYPSLGRAVFAPFFCMSLFGASSRGVRVARGVSGGIVLLVLLVRRLEQPWRGVIDAGVVVGLGIGLLSIGFHGIRALAGSPPAIDADLPAGDALFGGSGQDAGCMSACHVLTILAVEDLPRLVAFYDAAFGWYKAVDVPVYVEFSLDGGMRLGLYDRRGFGQNIGGLPERISPGSTGPTELYFHVEDLPSAISRMEQAGGRLLSPRSQRPWGDEAAYFADPEGNVLVLARPGLGG